MSPRSKESQLTTVIKNLKSLDFTKSDFVRQSCVLLSQRLRCTSSKCCKSKNPKVVLYEKGKDKIFKEFDVVRLFQLLRQIKLMRRVLLTPAQQFFAMY